MTLFNSSKYSFDSTFYCAVCHDSNPEVLYLPSNVWCRENNYTRMQLYTLLRKRKVVGLRTKGKMYVAFNPYYDGD